VKNFIERAKQMVKSGTEIVKNAATGAVATGAFGAIVIGLPVMTFIAGSGVSALLFGAGVMACAAGAIGFAVAMVQGMYTAAGSSKKTDKAMAARALIVAAGAATLCFNGVPRASAENQASGNVTATANAAFAGCPADKRVTTVTQDAQGRPVATLTCRP
jgi:hypothetical protein